MIIAAIAITATKMDLRKSPSDAQQGQAANLRCMDGFTPFICANLANPSVQHTESTKMNTLFVEKNGFMAITIRKHWF